MAPADASAPPLSGTSEMLAGFGAVKRLESHGPVTLFTGWSDEHQRNVLLHRVEAAAFRAGGPGARFLEAAKAALELRHFRLMPPLSLFALPDGAWCMASTWAPGATLAAELDRQGPLNLETGLQLIQVLCQGLVIAHAHGVVHAAIRPEMVVLGPRGVSDARLTGFATWALPRADGQGSLVAEAGFTAPECLAGATPTPACDVYSLASVLCAALRGKDPAEGKATRPLRGPGAGRELPAALGELEPVVARCLSANPLERPQTVEELMAELGKTSDTLIPLASPPSSAPPVPPPPPVRGAPGQEQPGDVLGAYALVKELGEGSMGKVFLARHVMLGRQVALKLLKAEQLDRPELISRFFQEARAVNQINHEHIVEVFDFVQEQGPEGLQAVYCVMELLRGETLSAAIEGKRLTVRRVAHIMAQVTDALAAAHQVGVVHRDLKPDNIFLIERGGQGDYVKVLDFGVAKLTTSNNELPLVATVDGVVIGTPAYMSPEQIQGEHVDQRSDIYAAGVILHELLSGRLPFEAANFALLSTQILTRDPPPLPATMPGGEAIPEGLRELTQRLLAKDVRQRPQSMAEVRAALLPFARAEAPAVPAVTPVVGVPAVPAPLPRGGRGKLALAAAAVLLLGAGGFAVSRLNRPPPEPPVEPLLRPAVPAPPAPLARVKPPGADKEHGDDHDHDHPAPPTPPPPVVVAPPDPPKPAVKERPVQPLTPKDIGGVVARAKSRLLGCFEKNAGQLQDTSGKVEIELAILESGAVSSARVTTAGIDGTPLSDCVVKEAQRLKFPRHPGPTVKVAVPFAWRSSE